MIAFFPLGAFIITYILGEYGGHYIMTVFLLGAGFYYVQKGIEKKDELRLALGVVVFVYTLVLKLTDILGEHIDGKFMIGLFTFILGTIFLGAVVYIRNKWTVSECVTPEKLNESKHEEVIDS